MLLLLISDHLSLASFLSSCHTKGCDSLSKRKVDTTNPSLVKMPFYGTYANSGNPDQTPHYAASDQGLHCLLTEFSIEIKNEKYHTTTLKTEMDWSN